MSANPYGPWAACLLSAWLLGACVSAPPLARSGQNGPSLRFAPYQLIVRPKAGQAQRVLDFAERQFGSRTLDQLTVGGQGFYLLRLEPAKVQALGADAASATLAAARQLQARNAGWLDSLELNPLPESTGDELRTLAEASARPSPAPSGLFNDLSFGIGSGLEGWWRTETQVEAAWQFSIGTGVTAAYLDQGFVKGHPELARRMMLNRHNNQTSEYVDSQPDNIELPVGDHGTASLLVGFGERDNHIPSVGVAPNASFIPYVSGSVWDASRALLEAARQHPQVIGMNMALPVYPRWEDNGEFRQYQLFKAIFATLAQSGIPVVVPAHNYGEPISGGPRDWVPIAWNQDYDNIIGVGGVQVQSGPKIRAWFSKDLMTGINARGSNYGKDLIWAPATLLDIANARADVPLPASMNGTSAACPFMTGVVALLRSRFPELTAHQLRTILLASGRPVPADDLMQQPGATVPLIQVENAFKAALSQLGKDPAAYTARRMTGRLIYASDGQRRFESNGQSWKVLPTLVSLQVGVPAAYDGQQLSLLGWTGIPPLQADELEILHIESSRP